MRPRPSSYSETTVGGPAELLNSRGTIELLLEDHTASFARASGRGGTATSNIKRYEIDRVYHKSLAGGLVLFQAMDSIVAPHGTQAKQRVGVRISKRSKLSHVDSSIPSHGKLSCDEYRMASQSQPPDLLRMRIGDEILTLRCPLCSQAFLDSDGCAGCSQAPAFTMCATIT